MSLLDCLLNSLEYRGIDLTLERITSLLAHLDNPHLKFPIVHVAGTNGKGSVCAYLCSILTEAGYKSGLYISPHLVDWNERISINKKLIPLEELTELVAQIIDLSQRESIPVTQFETITAAAWLYFAQNSVDIAVIEVGLGGRLDATNVVPNPLVTVVTSISHDHTQQLGPALTDIAREKSGILKPYTPAVVGRLPPDGAEVIQKRAQELNSPISWITPATENMGSVKWQDLLYQLPLNGDIQLQNSALAIAVCRILSKGQWQIPDEVIVKGIASTKWPGRLQWLNWRGKTILVDGAHNSASSQALRNYINRLNKPVEWFIGMISTKDHQQILSNLLKKGDRLNVVRVPSNLSCDPQYLANLAGTICPELEQIEVYSDLLEALERADCQERLLVVTGSLYLVGYLLADQPTQS